MERKIYEKKLMQSILSLAIVMTLFVGNTSTAKAFSVTNGNHNFKKAWEASTTKSNGKAVLIYGYNTTAINEDYSHAYHSTKSHYAYVKNGKGSYSGSNKSKGRWSKIEVTHKGSSIKYGNSY